MNQSEDKNKISEITDEINEILCSELYIIKRLQ